MSDATKGALLRCAWAFGFTMAWPRLALAGDPVSADALFLEGRKLLGEGKLEAACARFAESQKLDPAPGTLLNLADCHERRGQVATAWNLYRKLKETVKPDDERRALAEGKITLLEPTLPKMLLVVRQKAAHVDMLSRDGIELGGGIVGATLPVDPGAHVIVVRLRNERATRTLRVEAALGATREVVLDDGARFDEGPRVADGARPAQETNIGSAQRVLGLSAAGVGVVGLSLGAYFGIRALGKKADSDELCQGNLCSAEGVRLHDDAKGLSQLSDLSLLLGVVGLTAGAVLYLTAKSPTRAAWTPRPGGLAGVF